MPPKEPEWPHLDSYKGYIGLANSGKEQPLTMHADRFEYNYAYGNAAYSKGEVFLAQLGYLIGQNNLEKTIKKYYTDYKFSHPTPNDIKNVAQKISGANLDWYLNEWSQTTNKIDYAFKDLKSENGKANLVLERLGNLPMPVEVLVEYTDGTVENIYIPLTLMRWSKPTTKPTTETKPWDWAYPTFTITLQKDASQVKKVTIDPTEMTADVKRDNNKKEF
jgi:Peptidase family M1 domain